MNPPFADWDDWSNWFYAQNQIVDQMVERTKDERRWRHRELLDRTQWDLEEALALHARCCAFPPEKEDPCAPAKEPPVDAGDH